MQSTAAAAPRHSVTDIDATVEVTPQVLARRKANRREEFLLVMPDTPQDVANRTLNRLREMIAGLDWAAISPSMTVTLSAGVTSVRANDTTDTVLSRADRALYHAKERGRNRVHVA
jgi:diguanylate cyclase (GGDEF)-like protein